MFLTGGTLPELLGITCITPREVTVARRFFKVSKAVLCGRSIKRPNKDLNKNGYLSASSNCNRRSLCRRKRKFRILVSLELEHRTVRKSGRRKDVVAYTCRWEIPRVG